MHMVGQSAAVLAADNTGAIALGPMLLLLIIFGLGSLLSLAKKEVTWIDAFVMVGLGILIGATPVGGVVAALTSRLGEVLPG